MPETARQSDVRRSLADRLTAARAETDFLFDCLSPDALLHRPIRERHRVIFYIGHLEAFDWNLIGRHGLGLGPMDEAFDRLFAFGIDPVDGDLPDDQPSDWPAYRRICEYVRQVRLRTDRLLQEAELDEADMSGPRQLFEVAIEHRLMHAETLAYMLHWVPLEWKRVPAPDPEVPDWPVEADEQVTVPGGTVTMGLAGHADVFGWDNEFGLTRVAVEAFRMDRYDVTNARFLEFVNEGGYRERSLWSPESWEWTAREGIEHPRFWESGPDGWMIRNMFDRRPLPPSWPVYVSWAEASAYARWAGKRLPTEAEFHRAAYATTAGGEAPFPWGSQPPDPYLGNFGFARWNPTPVGSFPAGSSPFGIADLVGNGWEWTSTPFHPFDGFRKFEFYPGYSGDFFDGRHFVLKGGSPRTSSSLLRRSFRNWFQAHYPNIYATFRCVDT